MEERNLQPYIPPLIEVLFVNLEHAIAAGSVSLTVGGSTGSNTPMVESWEELDVQEQGFNL